MRIAIAAIAFATFFVLVEVIAVKTKLNREISRKTVHILAGVSAASLPLFMSFREIVYLSLLFIPVMLFSKKANILSSIHEVKRKTHGEVYFPFAILVTALAFPDKPLYMYGLLIMAISDGFASVIGQKYGKRKYSFLFGHKSYAGSLTFFLSAAVIGLIIMMFGTALVPSLLISIFMATALTLVEASLSSGLDNLVLPPVAAGMMLVLLELFSLR